MGSEDNGRTGATGNVRLTALCDSNYVAGMKAGYNFGVAEDGAGMQAAIENRQREYMAALARPVAAVEPVAHVDGRWCDDLHCGKCYSADFRFKHAAPPAAPAFPQELTQDQMHRAVGVLNLNYRPGIRMEILVNEIHRAILGVLPAAPERTADEMYPGCKGFTNGCACKYCLGAPAAPDKER